MTSSVTSTSSSLYYSPEVQSLKHFVEYGLFTGSFRQHNCHEEKIYSSTVEYYLKNNKTKYLPFCALFVWLHEDNSVMRQKLQDFFCNKAPAFQKELSDSLCLNMLVHPVICAEALLLLDSDIAALFFMNNANDVEAFLCGVINSDLPRERKDLFFTKFQTEIPHSRDMMFSLMISEPRRIKECSFYDQYHQAMSEYLNNTLESAKKGDLLPFPTGFNERRYFIWRLSQSEHPHSYRVALNFSQSDWYHISDDHSKNFYESCLYHSLSFSEADLDDREKVSNFYHRLTSKRDEDDSVSAYKVRRISLSSREKQFAKDVSQETLVRYLPSFHEDFYHLLINFYIKKDPAKLAGCLMSYAQHYPEKLPSIVESLQDHHDFFVFLLMKTPFSPPHFLILSKLPRESALSIYSKLMRINHEESAPRFGEWINYLTQYPDVLSTRLFNTRDRKFRIFQPLKEEIEHDKLIPSRSFIEQIVSPELKCFMIQEGFPERRNRFVALLQRSGSYESKKEELNNDSDLESTEEFIDWMSNKLENRFQPYVMVYLGKYFSTEAFDSHKETFSNNAYAKLNPIKPACLPLIEPATAIRRYSAKIPQTLFEQEARWLWWMVNNIIYFQSSNMGRTEETIYMQNIYMALCKSNTLHKVFNRVKQLSPCDQFQNFINRFAMTTPNIDVMGLLSELDLY